MSDNSGAEGMILSKDKTFLHATPHMGTDGCGFTVRSIIVTCWEEGKGEIRDRSILIYKLPHEVQLLYDVCLAAREALDVAMRKAIEAERKR